MSDPIFLKSPYQSLIDGAGLPPEAVRPPPAPIEPDDEDTAPAAAAPTAPASAPRTYTKTDKLTPPPELRPLFENVAAHFKVPVNVLMALAHQESRYNPDAKNAETGATGMAQYIGTTAKSLGINAADPNEAIPAAAMQLRERLDKGLSIQDAIKEHFAGPDRKLWGAKTAAYGDEVMGKAAAIGQELYGAQASDAPAPAKAGAVDLGDIDPSTNLAGATGFDPDSQLQEVPHAPAAAPAPKPAPAPKNPQQAGIAAPAKPAKPAPSMFDTVAGNAVGGTLSTLMGAGAGIAKLVGAKDTADEWEKGKEQVQARMQELGGDTMPGKVAGLVGGVLPALAAPEGMIEQTAANAGLFAIPAFNDTLKAKLAEGYSRPLALVHAAEAFGVNLVMPTVASKGAGALVGKIAGAAPVGAKGVAAGLGQAATEGVGFSGLNSVLDKGTDAIAGQQNDKAWLDPEDMAVQALGFGAMRAGHMAPHAVDAALDKVAPNFQAARALQEDAATNLRAAPGADVDAATSMFGSEIRQPDTVSPRSTVRRPTDVGPSPSTRTVPMPPQQEQEQAAPPAPADIPAGAGMRIEPTLGDPAEASIAGESVSGMDSALLERMVTNASGPAADKARAELRRRATDPAARPAAAPAAPGKPSPADKLRAIRPPDQIAPIVPAAPDGPLMASLKDAAAAHDADPAPLPVTPEPAPEPPALDTLPLADLQARVKALAEKRKTADPSMYKDIQAQRKEIEKAINAKQSQAKADSKPAEEPLATGPFEDMKQANKMMLRHAEATGAPHEVVPSADGFRVQRIGGQGDGVDTDGAGRGTDGSGRSGRPAADDGAPDGTRPAGTGDAPGAQAGTGVAAERGADAAGNRAGADGAADRPAAVAPTRDTRGTGVRFHGTSREMPGHRPNNEFAMSGDNRNIYGQGFYTTDAADISEGYMRKGKGKAPTLYEVKERGAPKLYDMEQDLTPEVRKMAERAMGDAFPDTDIDGNPITSLRALLDEFRAESQNHGLTRDEVQETFDAIRYNLEKDGYHGYRHVGGDKTGKPAHDVRIYWTPEDHVDVSKSDIAKYKGEPADVPEPAKVPEKAPAEKSTEGEKPAAAVDDQAGAAGKAADQAGAEPRVSSKPPSPKEARKAGISLTEARAHHKKQEDAIRQAAENIARRQAEKAEKAAKDEPRVIDEEGYLAQNGAGRGAIGDAGLHRSSERKSEKTHRKQVDAQAQKDHEVIARRAELRDEYAAKVAAGELRPPSAKEQTIARANGDPEMESTQAARRIAAKRGWDWAQKAEAAPQPAAAEAPAPTPQAKPSTAGERMRAKVKEQNPFLAFLSEHGIHVDERSDTGAEKNRPVMVPGYGQLYRKAGLRIDELAGLAHEAGFLSDRDMNDPTDNGGTRKLADMIERAAHRKEVIGRDDHAEASMPDADAELMAEAGKLGIDIKGKSADEVYDAVTAAHAGDEFSMNEARTMADVALDDDIPFDLDDPRTMRGRTLSDEELDAAFGTQSKTAGAREAGGQDQGDSPIAAPGRDAEAGTAREGADDVTGDGILKVYGRDEVVAKQDAQDATAKAEQAERELADKARRAEQDKKDIAARQDASADDFQLGQDAHDALAGQKDIFGGAPQYSVSGIGNPAERRFDQAATEAQHWLKSNGKTVNFEAMAPAEALSTFEEMLQFGTKGMPDAVFQQGRAIFERMDSAQRQLSRVEKMKAGDGPSTTSLKMPANVAKWSDERQKNWKRYWPKVQRAAREGRVTESDLHEINSIADSDGLMAGDALGKLFYQITSRPISQDVRFSQHPMAEEAAREVDPMLRDLADKGAIVLHDDASTLPVKGEVPDGVQALTAPDGTIHVVADALHGNAMGVVLHEAFHAGAKPLLGTKAWADLEQRLGSLYRQGEQSTGAARVFFDKARERVAVAKARGAVAPGMEHEEFGAYAIEEHANAPASVRKWVDDLTGAVKAWALRRFGRQLGDVTPAQLSSIAKLALMDKISARAEPAYSADNRKTVQVDGQRRPIENSNGKLIAQDMHKQMAFWRWAKDTKVVDEQGRPKVVFHGTNVDFAHFDGSKVGSSWDAGKLGKGFYFSTDPRLSGSYAMNARAKTREDAAHVMPVYLRIENPLEIGPLDFKAGENLWDKLRDFSEQAGIDIDPVSDPSSNQPNPAWSEPFRDALKRFGYDGVKLNFSDGHQELVAFDPEQVKSATGNDGSFDASNPDIRYSVGAPATPTVPTTAREKLSKLLKQPVDELRSVAHDVAIRVVPMATGRGDAQAVAKDFANQTRQAQAQWHAFDKVLREDFTKDDLESMWNAADQENDLRRDGKTSTTKGLNSLPPEQREVVEMLHAYGEQLWDRAKKVGLVDPSKSGVDFWTPRVAANVYADGSVERLASPGGEFSKDATNLRTSASSLKKRKYETTADSEAALQTKHGADAAYVKNIRVMPLAMAQLEQAIAGRSLVNQVKALGQIAGADIISDSKLGKNYETFDHPALKRWMPKTDWVNVDPADLAAKGHTVQGNEVLRANGTPLKSYRVDAAGNVQKLGPMIDSDGQPVMVASPLYIHKDFVGPMKAVLKTESPLWYRRMMQLKGAVTSMVMISPLTHNMVIWGKAMPTMASTMGWKNNAKNIATLGINAYVVGYKTRQNAALMNELIGAGLVPVSGRGMSEDVQGIAAGIEPGKSWTAQALGKVGDLAGKDKGDAVRRGVDKAGEFWHETLLWNRVADMQAGMAVMLRGSLMDKGFDQDTANRFAAHFANRYAGMVPQEAMSQVAHITANLALFSKSFNLTNVGAYKDVIKGLPGDVQAQILRNATALKRAAGMNEADAAAAGQKVLSQAQATARKKGATILALDIAAMTAITSITQALWQGQDADDIKNDFIKRAAALGHRFKEDPLTVAMQPLQALASLSQGADNAPGKEDRVRLGSDKKRGDSYYMRLPMGKMGEELKNYTNFVSAMRMAHNKMSTFARPFADLFGGNEDFQGQSIVNEGSNVFKQAAQFGAYWVKSQFPAEDVMALARVANGSADTMDKAKLLGTATGLTVARVAGGDAVAEIRKQSRDMQAKLRDTLPEAKEAIRRGKAEEAMKLLMDAGQTPRAAQRLVMGLENPNLISKGRLKTFMQTASPEEREKVVKMLNEK